jgi:hypothetical protein
VHRSTLRTALPIGLAAWFAPHAAGAAEPTVAECVAASNASLDLRDAHKLRAAREKLLVCASSACPGEIRKECLRRVDEVNAQMPTIVFQARDAAGKDLSDVQVTMDGQPFADRLEGTALPVDPGEHTFVFATAESSASSREASGQVSNPASRPLSRTLVIVEGNKDRRVIVFFDAPPPEAPVAPAVPVRPVPLAAAPTAPPEPGHGLGTQRAVALVVAGVGVAGVAAGAALGVVTIGKKHDAMNECPQDPCLTQHGSDLWSSATTSGNVATALLAVGGAALATGAVLWFTARPSDEEASAQVGIGPGTLQLRGSW